MPGIELSAGLMSGLPARILREGQQQSNPNPILPQVGLLMGGKSNTATIFQPIAHFCIMKGTIPTDPNTLIDYTNRSADILVAFKGINYNDSGTDDFALTDQASNPSRISGVYEAAIAAGTASWFWWFTRRGYSTSFDNTTIYNSIIGSVGVTGSGADIEIPNVTIGVGNQYRLRNIGIQFPSAWSY